MSFICEYCKKSYSRSTNLRKHQATAKFCLQKRGLLEPIPKKEEPKIAAKPKITAKPKTVAPEQKSLTDAVNDKLDTMNIFSVNKGEESYAKFAADILKNHVSCVKKSIHFLDDDGNLVKDSTGKKFSHAFFKAIDVKNKKILDTEYRDIQKKVQTISQEGRAGYVDITSILGESTKIYDIRMATESIVKGIDNDFSRDFVKFFHRFSGK